MPPRLYEIYAAKIAFRNADYERPWIVLSRPYTPTDEPLRRKYTVAPISSALELRDDAVDFTLRQTADGFETTGLRRESYIVDAFRVWADECRLQDRVGELTGALLDECMRWNGDA